MDSKTLSNHINSKCQEIIQEITELPTGVDGHVDEFDLISLPFKLSLELLKTFQDEESCWENEDKYWCLEEYTSQLNDYLTAIHNHINNSAVFAENNYHNKRLNDTVDQISELQQQEWFKKKIEIGDKYRELKKLQHDKEEYLIMEEELNKTSIEDLKTELIEINGKYETKKTILSQIKDINSEISNIDDSNDANKFENNIININNRLQNSILQKEINIANVVKRIDELVCINEEIDVKIKDRVNITKTLENNINVIERHYPELKQGESSFNEMKEKLSEYENKLKQAINAREKSFLKLQKIEGTK